MQSSRCFMGYRCLLLLAFMTLMPSFAICEEKNSASVAESEKRNENEWVFLLTPEFRRKVEKFKISPLEAAIILFREYNREVTSVEKLRGISDFGSLRCIKGNDYVFSLTPYIPKKGVLMDGIYLDGFTGEYRTILYSENHRDKYVKIPQFGLCYFSIPLLAVSSEQEWIKIVDSACPSIPDTERHKWAEEQFKEILESRKWLQSLGRSAKFTELMESFQRITE